MAYSMLYSISDIIESIAVIQSIAAILSTNIVYTILKFVAISSQNKNRGCRFND